MTEKIRKPEEIKLYWGKFVPAGIIAAMIFFAYLNFIREYGFLSGRHTSIPPVSTFYFPIEYFYIDFYIFSIIFTINIFLFLFDENFYVRFVSFFGGIASATLLAYTSGDLFTIKLFIFCGWILSLCLALPNHHNIVLSFVSSLCFLSAQYHPNALGTIDSISQMLVPQKEDILTLAVYCLLTTVFSCIYKHAVIQWAENMETAQHINMVMTQMSVFNQKLQNIAKTRGDESAKQERMRITRDMHDSCGYVFVNIVALMDAAESRQEMTHEQVEEIFMTVRNLAADGLQETRKTLHAIRNIENPIENSIDAIYDIKKIFEQVTGIQVTVDTGNIKHDYGRTIDSIIIRTMQEALTNAIRHGRAEHIFVTFWEENSILTMSVKDDGIGSKQIVKGIGLAGMEERLEKAGGTLEIESPKEGGFKITVHIPLTEQEGNSSNGET
ncbi:MAG: sensor histidine kinase [Treponema sp.]|nr:sensor histidine kinase [Treponema sp.]